MKTKCPVQCIFKVQCWLEELFYELRRMLSGCLDGNLLVALHSVCHSMFKLVGNLLELNKSFNIEIG